MEPRPGFYSLIQYVPDPERAEGVNVGVVLVCPEDQKLHVLVLNDTKTLHDRCLLKNVDGDRFVSEMNGLATRIREESAHLRSVEDLVEFSKQEANRISILKPRRLRVTSLEENANQLYMRLVHVEHHERIARVKSPKLVEMFTLLKLNRVPFAENVEFDVPFSKKKISVPYVYVNKNFNLIHPYGFSARQDNREQAANNLAVQGRLLFKYPDSDGRRKQIVVVAKFSENTPQEERFRISGVLKEHDVRMVPETNLDEFAKEIQETARQFQLPPQGG